MKILHIIAAGVVAGTGLYVFLTSFNVLPSSRSAVYGLLIGAAVTAGMSHYDYSK